MKVLFFGLGSIGQRHVRNLRQLYGSSIEILAYRTRNQSPLIQEDMSADFSKSPEEIYGIKSFSTIERALQEKPQIAFITNPASMHLSSALAAAKAGCHLFIEKPISHDLTGISELQKIIKEKKLISFVGYHTRFHPAIQQIKKLLLEKKLGKILSAQFIFATSLKHAHPYEDYKTGCAARKDLGGGVVLSLIHELDLCYHFFGSPSQVFALGGQLSSLEIDAEDTASALLEYENEGRTIPIHVYLDFIQNPPHRTCIIVGDRGKIFFDYFKNTLFIYDYITKGFAESDTIQNTDSEKISFTNFKRNMLFLDEIKHFMSCVEENKTPQVSFLDGIESLKIALALKKSMQSKQVERVSPHD